MFDSGTDSLTVAARYDVAVRWECSIPEPTPLRSRLGMTSRFGGDVRFRNRLPYGRGSGLGRGSVGMFDSGTGSLTVAARYDVAVRWECSIPEPTPLRSRLRIRSRVGGNVRFRNRLPYGRGSV